MSNVSAPLFCFGDPHFNLRVAVHPLNDPGITGLAAPARVESCPVEYQDASFVIDMGDDTVEFTQVAVGVC